ncbi:MAG: aminoglycoside phosphotransferase family protein [Pseudomonadota bacterium]
MAAASETETLRALLRAQFPDLAGLPLTPVPSGGTDNAMVRVGMDLVARLPKDARAAALLKKEAHWLDGLPDLPLAVPRIRGRGQASGAFPHNWLLLGWLPGAPATLGSLGDQVTAARMLADFLRALWQMPPTLPTSPENNRGAPLASRDAMTRKAIAGVADLFEADRLLALWQVGLDAPPWDGTPRAFHGDLQAGNLLAESGRLTAVIDWGLAGCGDPAADLTVAWMYLQAEGRTAFRAALAPDDTLWRRGRALSVYAATIALSYYRNGRNPAVADRTAWACEQLLQDVP